MLRTIMSVMLKALCHPCSPALQMCEDATVGVSPKASGDQGSLITNWLLARTHGGSRLHDPMLHYDEATDPCHASDSKPNLKCEAFSHPHCELASNSLSVASRHCSRPWKTLPKRSFTAVLDSTPSLNRFLHVSCTSNAWGFHVKRPQAMVK